MVSHIAAEWEITKLVVGYLVYGQQVVIVSKFRRQKLSQQVVSWCKIFGKIGVGQLGSCYVSPSSGCQVPNSVNSFLSMKPSTIWWEDLAYNSVPLPISVTSGTHIPLSSAIASSFPSHSALWSTERPRTVWPRKRLHWGPRLLSLPHASHPTFEFALSGCQTWEQSSFRTKRQRLLAAKFVFSFFRSLLHVMCTHKALGYRWWRYWVSDCCEA